MKNRLRRVALLRRFGNTETCQQDSQEQKVPVVKGEWRRAKQSLPQCSSSRDALFLFAPAAATAERVLPLLVPWPRLALIPNDRMELDLDRILCVVAAVALAPIIADCVREDVTGAREGRGSDAAADLGVAFEAVFGVLVPEVEGTVAAGGAEGAVHGVEGDGVDRVDFGDIALGGVRLAMTLEGEVEAGWRVSRQWWEGRAVGRANLVSLSSTYWIAQRPSMEPTAKPVASVKQETTRVYHFKGLVMVL